MLSPLFMKPTNFIIKQNYCDEWFICWSPAWVEEHHEAWLAFVKEWTSTNCLNPVYISTYYAYFNSYDDAMLAYWHSYETQFHHERVRLFMG